MTLDAFNINFTLPFKVEKQVEQIECLTNLNDMVWSSNAIHQGASGRYPSPVKA